MLTHLPAPGTIDRGLYDLLTRLRRERRAHVAALPSWEHPWASAPAKGGR